MWIIDSIKFNNFMRYRDVELKLPEIGVFGIVAEDQSDKDRSNYIGKSTFGAGVRYVCTGNSDADKDIDLISHNEDVMFIEMVLKNTETGEVYPIKRGRTSKNEGILQAGLHDKTGDSQKQIYGILGLSKDDFDLTVFYKQDDIHSFMFRSPTEKKKLLMEWQDKTHWEEKEKLALSDLKDLNDKINELKITLRNIGSNKYQEEELNSNLVSLEEKREKILSVQTRINEFIESYSGITEQDFNKINLEIKDIQGKRESLVSKVAKINETFPKNLLIEQNNKYKELKGRVDKTSDIQSSYAVLVEKATNLKSELREAKESNSGICPILKETCERIVFTEEKEKDYQDRINSIEKEASVILKKLKDSKTKDEEESRLYKFLVQADSQIKNLPDMEDMIDRLNKKELELSKSVENYSKDSAQKFNEAKSKKFDCDSKLMEVEKEISVIKHKIEQNNKYQDQIIEITNEITELNKKSEDLKYVAYMFGKNGIPSLEIENSFQQLENDANDILADLDDAISTIFKPDRELNAWETHCLSCGWAFPKNFKKHVCEECNEPRRKKRKDELVLNITQNGKEVPFKLCSGGLRTLTSIAIRTALTLMLRRQNKCNVSFLFLDEIDSALDKSFKEKIKQLVVKVLHNKLGFNQIFWVSHDRTISDQVTQTMLVEGKGDYSTVEWV